MASLSLSDCGQRWQPGSRGVDICLQSSMLNSFSTSKVYLCWLRWSVLCALSWWILSPTMYLAHSMSFILKCCESACKGLEEYIDFSMWSHRIQPTEHQQNFKVRVWDIFQMKDMFWTLTKDEGEIWCIKWNFWMNMSKEAWTVKGSSTVKIPQWWSNTEEDDLVLHVSIHIYPWSHRWHPLQLHTTCRNLEAWTEIIKKCHVECAHGFWE